MTNMNKILNIGTKKWDKTSMGNMNQELHELTATQNEFMLPAVANVGNLFHSLYLPTPSHWK
jgi:hypothetical protein